MPPSRSKRRAAYSLAASAVVAASSSESNAAVQYFTGPIDVPQGSSQPIDFNLDGDYPDIVLKNYVFGGGNYQGATVPYAPGKIVGFVDSGSGLSYFSALTSGTLIDASSLGDQFVGSLAYGTVNPNAEFASITDGYLGFAFPIGPDDLYYAWMRIDVDNAAGTLTIKDWAFEDQTGVGIVVGDSGAPAYLSDFDEDSDVDGEDFLVWQRDFGMPYNGSNLADWQLEYGSGSSSQPAVGSVPEPGTLGLLAAGAGGLAWMRRRRSQQGE
ncbi:PEP-CTERM sorting domain-containing protein [Adhaeretor mobilis]|nr:PEP-CTERM sorting domain-containing protein [Adhaeretor mobilis]